MNYAYPTRSLSDVDCTALRRRESVTTVPVCMPDEHYRFLHEAAAIAYHGRIFAAWYQNGLTELEGETPIFWSCSRDGGKTFSEKRLLAVDPTGELLYCPPVFGICHDRLYLLANEMYREADHIHALDLFIYEEAEDRFVRLWSRPIPFKLNTNVCAMDNGKLLLPGRIAEMDGFPNTPAVLISDSGEIDGEWRLVYVRENGDLPGGTTLVHPEQSAIIEGSRITLFCRTDGPGTFPLLFVSEDFGETWSEPICYDVPVSGSKIYSGTLSNGRSYWIGNVLGGRKKLALLWTEPGGHRFTRGFLLQDGENADFPGSGKQWSYPVAFEEKETLYVIYTASVGGENDSVRGAVLSAIPFRELE